MNQKKKKILLIPGWWPCGFFTVPSELLMDMYDTYILKGDCAVYPLRKVYKYFKSHIHSTDNIRIVDIHLCWINYKKEWVRNWQYRVLENLVDKAVKQLMGDDLPDIVSIQSISDISPFVVSWAHKNNIKVILTEHQLHFRILSDYFSKLKYAVYRQVDKLLCVSNYLYRNLIINEFGVQKATIIGNLVDDVDFQETQLAHTDNMEKIVFVASHPHSKDIPVLFDVAELLQKNTTLEIDVIGLEQETLDVNIRSKHLENLKFKGKLSHKELLKSYSKYGMLLSTSSSETFGVSVAEALLNGMPVVCTDSGGIHEFVNSSNGVVVSIREPQQIYEAILQVHENLKAGKYNAVAMSAQIREKYGRKAYTKLIKKIYEEYTK